MWVVYIKHLKLNDNYMYQLLWL